MAQETIYKSLYFDIFKDFAEKNIIPSSSQSLGRSKYKIQGANPVKMLQKLERDISGTNSELFAKLDYNISKNKNLNILSIHEQETLKLEEDMWKFVTECVTADYVFIESKLEQSKGSQKTPMSLISGIIKGNHELLSCHYILKWLEKIYRQDTFMSNLLKLEFEEAGCSYQQTDMDFENYREFLNIRDKNADDRTSKFLYEAMRRGKLEHAKRSLIEVNQAWKACMLNGSVPCFDQIIDNSLQKVYCSVITQSEANSYFNRSSANNDESFNEIDKNENMFGNSEWFLYLKAVYQKSLIKGDGVISNSFERALYGSFCGNTDAMLCVSQTWDDYLWAYIKTILFHNVINTYIETENQHLEDYDIMYGDYYDGDACAKNEILEWEFPRSCPTDFDKILSSVVEKLPNSTLCFPNRKTNPFYDIMILLLRIQLASSKAQENENRWSILIKKIYELNDIKEFNSEDIIFLRFSVHLLILLQILERIDNDNDISDIPNSNTRIYYNNVILKYLSLQEEPESERIAFYLNFIYGDEVKVETYSDLIWPITGDRTQKMVLMQDIIDRIKAKLIEREKNPPITGSNISEIVQKMKWMYYKENFTEFYKSVVELARIFLLKDQLIKAESLYKELQDELNNCEDMEDEFKRNGFYHLLSDERKKHMNLIIILNEVKTYNYISNDIQNNDVPEDSSKSDANIRRRKRIISKIEGILRDGKYRTVLFDYPFEIEYPKPIRECHHELKKIYVSSLVRLYFELNLDDENYEACIQIAKFISGKEDTEEEMEVDEQEKMNLTPYVNQNCITDIYRNLSDLITSFVI